MSDMPESDENIIAGIIIGRDVRSENIKRLEREAGAKKTPELTIKVWLRCCGAELADGHLVGCEHYPMEVP